MAIFHRKLELDISSDLACERLCEFPNRFRHYRASNYKGEWTCNLTSCDQDTFCFQMIDKTFEPPKGRVKPNVPFIKLKLGQLGSRSVVDITLKWKLSKLIFALILGASFLLGNIFMSIFIDCPNVIALLLLSCILQIFYAYWVISNIFHDILTLKLFIELIKKI